MNTTKMTNKLILNLLIGGGLLAGLASCADESISLKDVNYPLYERLDTAGYQGYELVWSEEFDQDDVQIQLIGITTKVTCATKRHKII